MRIGLTYNLKPSRPLSSADDPIDRYEEFDSEETVDAVAQALRRLGHEVERLGWGPALLDALTAPRDRLDGVFNFAEGVGGRGRESQVPAMLEMLGIPNTGSDPVALALALDKGLAKLFAADHGIATAPFVHRRRRRAARRRRPPLPAVRQAGRRGLVDGHPQHLRVPHPRRAARRSGRPAAGTTTTSPS
jgi:hypothetical protein